MYAHKGRTKKLKRHGLHGFALDPTHFPTRISLKNISAQRSFFFEGPKVSKGKRLETVGDRTFARQKNSCFVAYVHEACLKIM